MHSRRSSPPNNNPNMSSGYTPPDEPNSSEEHQNPISSIPNTGPPVVPRPTALSNEGQSPFVSATSRVQLEGSSERILSTRTPPGGSNHGEVSPSPHREGRPLILSDPPSRNVSRAEGTTTNVGPAQGSSVARGGAREGNPPSVSTESSVTPTIRLAALDELLSPEQSAGIRSLISHHALQRQKLASAGSYLTRLHSEATDLRTSVESLTGRLNRVASDTVQLLLEGDNILAAISKAFEGPSSQGGPSLVELPVSGRLPYGQSYEDIYHIEEPTGNPQTLTNIIGEDSTGSRHSGNHEVEVLQEALPSGEGNC
jgi:hypothetical protein